MTHTSTIRRALWATAATLTLALALAAPATAQDPLDQTIAADEPVAEGPVELSTGHVDLGPRLIDGSWKLLIRDDSVTPSVWRHLDDSVIRVADAAKRPVPDDPTYGFLGVDPGTEVHVVPQIQSADVVWLGWNTQDPHVMEQLDRGATLSLVGAEGPGDVIVYLQSGNLTEPEVLWRSDGQKAQPLFVDVNTHTHANWVFTEPGTYLLKVEASGELISGDAVSDTQVIRFAVGDEVKTEVALEASYAGTGDLDAAPRKDGPATSAADDDSGSNGTLVVVGSGFVAILIIATLALATRGARTRAAARRVRTEARDDQGGRA